MGHSILFRRARVLCAVVFFAAVAARADTIVLKNGRRIVANNVREEGDKVKYETSAGELSLPKSIVDHIEKGGGRKSCHYSARHGRDKRRDGDRERRHTQRGD